MNQKHLWVTSGALAVLCACGAREGKGTADGTQGVGAGTQQGDAGTEQVDAANESYVGSWHQQGAAAGADMFIVLYASSGVMCGADGKSQAQFDLVHTGSALSMGSYAYGGGDGLEVIAGDVLQRTGEEKGVTYVVSYERWDDELPTWCREQLAELK